MITLDPTSGEAPFEQVRAQLAALIDTGELVPGTRLPTVRRLAADLGLATNTIARAYRELERVGLIATRGRAGSYVAGHGVNDEARAAAVAFLDRARALGLAPDQAVALVTDVRSNLTDS